MEAAMLSPDRVGDLTTLTQATADYDIVRRAIVFLSEHWRAQPEIEAIAEAAGVGASDLHHLFRRWAGITPKASYRVSGGCRRKWRRWSRGSGSEDSRGRAGTRCS